MTDLTPRKRSPLRTGFLLVVGSYLLWAPMLLFAALGLGANNSLWYRVSGATYVLSWLLFTAGFIVGGTEAARAGRRWVARMLKRNITPGPADQPPTAPQ